MAHRTGTSASFIASCRPRILGLYSYMYQNRANCACRQRYHLLHELSRATLVIHSSTIAPADLLFANPRSTGAGAARTIPTVTGGTDQPDRASPLLASVPGMRTCTVLPLIIGDIFTNPWLVRCQDGVSIRYDPDLVSVVVSSPIQAIQKEGDSGIILSIRQ